MACADELIDCATHRGLWSADGACRWPTAELCLKSCGQCPRVRSARSCTSLPDECEWAGLEHGFCGERMDWASFFDAVVAREEHNGGGARVVSRQRPWLAEFPHFLSPAEADEIIRIGLTEGLRDEDEHPARIRNVSVTNCDSARCMQQPFMNELSRRVSALLGAPSRNFESMEFVRYEPGQHYTWHPDEYSWRRQGWPASRTDPVHVLSGPRVLTMFFYLSDVDEGGETGFMGARSALESKGEASSKTRQSKLPSPSPLSPAAAPRETLKMTPRKGKAILWANVQEDWRSFEPAAMHRAFPVRSGIKWASTLWIHAAGFRIPELYAGPACQPPR